MDDFDKNIADVVQQNFDDWFNKILAKHGSQMIKVGIDIDLLKTFAEAAYFRGYADNSKNMTENIANAVDKLDNIICKM